MRRLPAMPISKGTESHVWATYYFSSEGNKILFEGAPQKFTPQYGGFCAVAVSEGKTFPIDPHVYTIEDGNLYLFYNGKLGNTKPQWEADATIRKTNADQHWKNADLTVVYPTVECAIIPLGCTKCPSSN